MEGLTMTKKQLAHELRVAKAAVKTYTAQRDYQTQVIRDLCFYIRRYERMIAKKEYC
jgi:hypothetical protein